MIDGKYSIVEASDLTGIQASTIRRKIKSGELEAELVNGLKGGKVYVVSPEAIDTLLKAEKSGVLYCPRGDCRFIYDWKCTILSECLEKPSKHCAFFKEKIPDEKTQRGLHS